MLKVGPLRCTGRVRAVVLDGVLDPVAWTTGDPGEEHLPFIFERFYRVRGGEKAVTGTGLGLYICRQIIQAHRGKIWAESTPGQGPTFFIQLPIDSTS